MSVFIVTTPVTLPGSAHVLTQCSQDGFLFFKAWLP